MYNAGNIFIAPASGPASALATPLATVSSTIDTGYFLFDGTDFDDGSYTSLMEIKNMFEAMCAALFINTVNQALTTLRAATDPTREEALRIKQTLIDNLVTALESTPYAPDKMAANLANQLFDPNVGTITSGFVTGASGTNVDVAQVVIDFVKKA